MKIFTIVFHYSDGCTYSTYNIEGIYSSLDEAYEAIKNLILSIIDQSEKWYSKRSYANNSVETEIFYSNIRELVNSISTSINPSIILKDIIEIYNNFANLSKPYPPLYFPDDIEIQEQLMNDPLDSNLICSFCNL